jgi:N-methylhydantoinase A
VTQVLDVRYVGQASELPVALTSELDECYVAALVDEFHALHKASYGHALAGAVEVVRVRTTVTGGRPTEIGASAPGRDEPAPAPRTARFADWSGEVRVVRRADLARPISGPLLVDDPDTTTVVPPGWVAGLDDHGNIRLEVRS